MATQSLTKPADSADPRLERLLKHAARLPSPPAVVMALLASLGDESASVDDIAAHAERDQALTARLLRVGNSSYYGLAGRVATVRDATVVLGVNNVRNLMIATEMINRYQARPGGGMSLAPFWRHGLVTAFFGAALARRCGAEEGIAFTAGLLHDIGMLVLASANPEQPLDPAADTAAGAALERERFGVDHASLGAMIAERWRFPSVICNAIRMHHDAAAPEKLVRLVMHAEGLASVFSAPTPPAGALQLCADALSALGSRHTAPDLFAELEQQAATAAELAAATA